MKKFDCLRQMLIYNKTEGSYIWDLGMFFSSGSDIKAARLTSCELGFVFFPFPSSQTACPPCRLMSSWCRALGSFSYWTACCLHWRKGDIRWNSIQSQKLKFISNEKGLISSFEITSSHVYSGLGINLTAADTFLLVQLVACDVDYDRSQLMACTVTCC